MNEAKLEAFLGQVVNDMAASTAILNLRFDKEFTVIGTSYGSNVFDQMLPNLSK